MYRFKVMLEAKEYAAVAAVADRHLQLLAFFLLQAFQALACTFNREALFMQQPLDLQKRFNVLAAV